MLKKDDALLQSIVENCSDPQFNVSALAEKVGQSASYLREYAYTHYGMSVQLLIETIRLERAVESARSEEKQIAIEQIRKQLWDRSVDFDLRK